MTWWTAEQKTLPGVAHEDETVAARLGRLRASDAELPKYERFPIEKGLQVQEIGKFKALVLRLLRLRP